MSKFCENCGAEMDENQTVCPNCGFGGEPKNDVKEEPVNLNSYANNSTNTSSYSNSNNSKDPKKIGIIAGVVAAVIAVIVIISSILGGGWKKPIDNYYKGQEKADAETYLSAFPDYVVKDMEYYYKIDDKYMDTLLAAFEKKYGDKVKFSYKVTSSDSIKKDDLKKVQKYISMKYEEDVKVSAGKKVKLKVTVKGKDDKSTTPITVYVYKIDNQWKFLDDDGSFAPSDAKSYIDSH